MLNVIPNVVVYTYGFIYEPGHGLIGPDWYVARRYRPDLIEVPQVDFAGPALSIKDLINQITSENGYYAILRRHNNLFGIAWSERPFIDPQQRYVA